MAVLPLQIVSVGQGGSRSLFTTGDFGPGGRLSLLMAAHRKEGRRRSLFWQGVLDREDGAPTFQRAVGRRERGAPCLRRAVRRGRIALPVSNGPPERGKTAFPAGREPPEGSPALRKDRRGRGSFALRCGLYVLAPCSCAPRLDAELDPLRKRHAPARTSLELKRPMKLASCSTSLTRTSSNPGLKCSCGTSFGRQPGQSSR